jgi:hypothetical protein
MPVWWQIGTTIGPALLAGAPATTATKFAQLGRFAKIGRSANMFGRAYSVLALDPAYWGSYISMAARNKNVLRRLGNHLYEEVKEPIEEWGKKLASGKGEQQLFEGTLWGKARQSIADLPVKNPIIRKFAQVLSLSDESRAGAVMGQTSATLQNWLIQAGDHAAEQIKFLGHLSDLDDPKTKAAAQKALDALGFGEREIGQDAAKGWGLTGTTINQLNSEAGYTTRLVLREMAGTDLQRSRIGELLRVGKRAIPEGETKEVIDAALKAKEEAGNELMALMAEASSKVAGVGEVTTKTGVKKFLNSWQKAQGHYAKWFHMGPVPGLAVRNASTDLAVMALNHAYSWKSGEFLGQWGDLPEATQRGFAGWGKTKVAARDINVDIADDANQGFVKKWIYQSGLTLSGLMERKNASIAWVKGAKYVFNRFWRSGAVSDGVVDSHKTALGLDNNPELVAELKAALREEVMRLEDISRVIKEHLMGEGVKYKRGRLDSLTAELRKDLADTDVTEDVQKILKKHADTGNLDEFLEDIEKLRTDNWLKSMPPDSRLAPDGSHQAQIEDWLEEIMGPDYFDLSDANKVKVRAEYKEDLNKWRIQMEMNHGWAQYTIDKMARSPKRDELQKRIHKALTLRNEAGRGVTKVGGYGIEEARAGTKGKGSWDSYRTARDNVWMSWQAKFIEEMRSIMREAEDVLGGAQVSDMPEEVAAHYRPQRQAGMMDDAVGRADAQPMRGMPTGKMPSNLKKGTPKYNKHTLEWESDVEQALYTVRSKRKRSTQDAAYMEWLRTQFPGQTDDEIRQMGNRVLERVKAKAKLYPSDSKAHLRIEKGPQEGEYMAAHADELAEEVMWETMSEADLHEAGMLQLPRGLRFAKPRYGNRTMTWESDLDMALYIVRSSRSPLSKGDPKYMAWLRTIFPDLSDSEIRALGESVKDRVTQTAQGTDPYGDITIRRSTGLPIRPKQRPIRPTQRAAATEVPPTGRGAESVADALNEGRPTEPRLTYDYTSAAPRDMALDKVKKQISDEWYVPAAETTVVKDFDAVRKLELELRAELSGTRQLADRFGGEFRDYVLHNYGRRYNFDTALSVPFGYPFWYTRTYAKWFAKAMGQDPFAVAAVYRLNNTMEQWNRDIEAETGLTLPRHLKRAVQRLPFGLEKQLGDHIAIPILKNFIPIQGAIDGQWRNTERLKNVVGANYEGMYGFGLGSHALLPQILAGYHYYASKGTSGKQSEEHMKQALQYTGYFGSAQRAGSSASAKVAEWLGVDLPGGVGFQVPAAIANITAASSGLLSGRGNVPMLAANLLSLVPQMHLMWAKRPGKGLMYVGTIYDQGRVDKKLAEMARNKEISDEVGMDAALLAGNPQRFLDSEEMITNGAVAAWEEAVRQTRREKAKANYLSWIGGPAVKVRTKSEIETQAMYEEVDALYAMGENPDISPEEYSLAWTTFRLKNPEFAIGSMARRIGSDRERNYTWNVLSRIGKGRHTDDIYDSIGGEGFHEIVNKWYDTKGYITSKIDKDKLRAGILAVGLNVALPDIPSGEEWKIAGQGMAEIFETLALQFPGTEQLLEKFYDIDPQDTGAKQRFRFKHPDFDERLKAEEALIFSDKYRDTVAPYYASKARAERYLVVMHDAPFDEEFPGVSRTYHTMQVVARDEDWKDNQKESYINSIPGMREYHSSWLKFKDGKDDALAVLAKHIKSPELPTVRQDAPEGVASEALQKVIKEMGPALGEFQGAALTGAEIDPTDPRAWGAIWDANQEISQVYFDDNKELWLTNALKPILADSKITSVSQWDVSKDTPLLSGWPVDAKGSDALIAYVRQQGATSLREAMMLETRNGVHKELGAWRVIGTILSLSPAEIRTLADTVSELHDIERVNWYATGNPQPTLDVLMRSMGFRAAFDKKGVLSLRKEADIGPLLTDENDRYIGDPDLHEYIRNLSEAEWGPDIDLLHQQFSGLWTAGQYEAAMDLLKDEPLIAAYDALKDEIFARFRAAKAGPGSKTFIKFMADVAAGKRTGDISKLMQSVLSGGSRTESAVRSAAKKSRAKSVSASKIRSSLFDFHVLREPKPSRPRQTSARRQRQQTTARQRSAQPPPPDLTPWLTLQAKLKAESPSFLTVLMDYFDLSAYARGAHLQRNPDLARWLSTVPAAQLAAIEQAYYIWAQQTGRITPRQERRVSRSRPALGSTLRVYKPRGERAGL